MIEIEEIQLDGLVLPSSRIGMVIAQPFIEIDVASEPYKWVQSREEHQLNVIKRTLEIAKACDHGCEKTHFTVFPEYSIPGLEGIALIEETINKSEWKTGTVVIAGIDGLTEDQFQSLCTGNNTFVQQCNRVTAAQDRWINCCITWVKYSNQSIRRWIQLKLSPAWPERNIEHRFMKQGKGIFLFKSKFDNEVECLFFSLICFDWIGRINSEIGIEAILQSLNSYYQSGSPRKIHFIFLLQYNDKPNHRDFLGMANWFFERRDHSVLVDRADSVIVYANSANTSNPGKYSQLYGFSSIISAPEAPYDNEACPPTYAVKTKKLRGNEILRRPIDALFRENAACIHSVVMRIPQFVGRGPSDRCLPIEFASVHSTDGSVVDDPRLPGNPVPAIVKWVNDALDTLPHVLQHDPSHPLRSKMEQVHDSLVKEVRWMSSIRLQQYVIIASAGSSVKRNSSKWIKAKPNVDLWDTTELSCLETILHALTILRSCRRLDILTTSAHGMLTIGNKFVDVMIVRDTSHEDAYKHCLEVFRSSGQRYLMLITRDDRNSYPVRGSILDVSAFDLTKDPVYTDVASRTFHFSFGSLCNCCDTANSDHELETNLKNQFRL